MRKFVFVALAAILALAGCSGEYQPEQRKIYLDDNEDVAYQISEGAGGITETAQPAEIEILVDGNLKRFYEMLGLSPMDMRDALSMDSTHTDLRFPIINGRMYRFPWRSPSTEHRAELRLDSFDLSSGTEVRDQLIRDFSPEAVFYYSFAPRGLTVHTAATAYLFDHNFELLHRVPWPEHIPIERRQGWWGGGVVFNDDFTMLAFGGTIDGVEGAYLIDLTAGTPPTLLHERVLTNWDGWWEGYFEWSTPVLFIDGERLFMDGGFETTIAGTFFYRLVDFDGNVLEEFPFGASGAYAGGFVFANTSMVIFEPRDWEQGSHYFDFDDGVLHSADWWARNEYESWSAYIPDPNNPRVWYVSSVLHRGDRSGVGSEERSYILRLNFENKTIEPLLTMTEMSITLMSVGSSGELVFAYSGQSGSGFAVFVLR